MLEKSIDKTYEWKLVIPIVATLFVQETLSKKVARDIPSPSGKKNMDFEAI